MSAAKRRSFWQSGITEEEYQRQRQKILETAPVPVFWLFGKTGSGKTSIIRYLTGAEEATIGDGFRPQTRFSRQFDFPTAQEPLLRFLDTRGLGEATYDPAEDLSAFHAKAHVIIVTVRLRDRAVAEIVQPLRQIRAAERERPVVLALTCLHEAYPGQQHPSPDPFASPERKGEIPSSVAELLAEQQTRFAGLVDHVVPIDFTRAEEGFHEPHFGGSRLKETLLEVLPAAYRQSLLGLDEVMASLKNLNDRRAMPYVLSSSMMAAAAAAAPWPWVDIPVVTGIQTHLVTRLAAIYGQKMQTRDVLQLLGPLGGRVLLRSVVRESLKLIPVVGMAANAGAAYAYTFALGKACCWYYGQIKAGNAPAPADLRRIWNEQLALATRLWKEGHHLSGRPSVSGEPQ